MRSFVSLLVAAFLVVGSAAADENAAKKPRRLTAEEAADAVLVAIEARDKQALKSLAEQNRPDPWLVADLLCYRGEHDAAEAFANVAPRADVEMLAAYVAAWRKRAPDTAARDLLDVLWDAIDSGAPQEVLEGTSSAEAAVDSVLQIKLLEVRGAALKLLKKPAEREAVLLRAAESASALGWLRRAVSLYGKAGFSARGRCAWASTLSSWKERVALCERRGDERGAAKTLIQIGLLHLSCGAYQKALDAFELVAPENEVAAAIALNNMGEVHRLRGDYEEAIEVYQRALTLLEKIGDEAGAATTLGNIGKVHQSRGDFEKAAAIYDDVLKKMQDLGEQAGEGRTLNNIGRVLQSRGEYVKALNKYKKALKLKEALGDRAGEAMTLGNMGNVHNARGDYAAALEFLQRALGKWKALGNKAGEAEIVSYIGNVHQSLGDYATALELLQRALALMQTLGVKAGEATTLGNIGNVHQSSGDHGAALEAYELALKNLEALGSKAAAATTLGNIGVAYDSLGKYEEALDAYQKSLALKETLGDRAGVAMTLGNIGEVHQHLGNFDQARTSLEKSVDLARELKATPQRVAAWGMLARLELETGDASGALSTAEKALEKLEDLLVGLADEQGASARGQYANLFAVGTLAAVAEKKVPAAFKFLESGRAGALLDMLGGREALREYGDSVPEELRRAEREAQTGQEAAAAAYERVRRGRNRPLREIRRARMRLDEAAKKVRTVAERIQRHAKKEAEVEYPRAKAIGSVRDTLMKDQALVLYGLCLDKALALVLRRGGARIVALGKVEDVEIACEELRASDVGRDPTAALARLKDLLVTPLKLGADVKQVVVSPEGPLCYLPLGALFEQPVATTPSGTTHVVLLEGNESAPDAKVLALGDPDYGSEVDPAAALIYTAGGDLPELPATRVEAEAVGDVVLVGKQASESGLRETLAKEERWRAVHLACHGLVKPADPMLSSLALSQVGGDHDGFLTGREVLRMEIPADLVVLSACETATGKLVQGEGIVGLTRAFMYAGSPRVICSLWKVDDEATQALMIKFYDLWNPKEGKGLRAAEALKRAQDFVRGQEQWKHPYYWAAWVLWGLPD